MRLRNLSIRTWACHLSSGQYGRTLRWELKQMVYWQPFSNNEISAIRGTGDDRHFELGTWRWKTNILSLSSWNSFMLAKRYWPRTWNHFLSMLFSILVITVTHPNMTVCSVTVKCKCNQCYLNFLAVCDVRGELLTAAALITVSRSGYRPCTINFPYQKSRIAKKQHLTWILRLSGNSLYLNKHSYALCTFISTHHR